MEYVDGPNLDTLVRKQGPLPISVACEMMRQAAQALQCAHTQNMVHRDIKPANLLIPRTALAQLAGTPPEGLLSGTAARPSQNSVGPSPLVKVVDFGLARLHNTTKANTLMLQNEKSFMGTPDYVSPEQASNVHAVDIRSDLYSLGCTFYHALTGSRPFLGTTALETVVKHLKDDPRPLEEVRPETPLAVSAIVRRLMAKEPAKRFQTPAELIAELEFLCGEDKPRLTPSLKASAAPVSGVANRVSQPAVVPPAASVLAATAVIPALTGLAGLAPPTCAPLSADPACSGSDVTRTPADALSATVATAPAIDRAGVDEKETAAPAPEAPPAQRAPLSATEMARLDANLRRAWQRWTAVIEAVSRGRGYARVSEPDYRSLHGELLALCRAQIDHSEGAQRERFRLLEGMVEPWLTPRTLAAADREALADLLSRCRQIEQELGVARGNWALWTCVAALLFLGVAAALGWQLYNLQRSAAPARTWLVGLWKVVETNPVLWAALVVPAVVFLSIALLARWFRA
jgi:hypothetical protein